jgi:hypothetical protein
MVVAKERRRCTHIGDLGNLTSLVGSVCQETKLKEKWTGTVGVVMVGRRGSNIYIFPR